jgi:hypothetical protein
VTSLINEEPRRVPETGDLDFVRPGSPSFLTIPAEIRLKIYELVLLNSHGTQYGLVIGGTRYVLLSNKQS